MSYHKVQVAKNNVSLEGFQAVVVAVPNKLMKSKDFKKILPKTYSSKIANHLQEVAQRRQWDWQDDFYLGCEVNSRQLLVVLFIDAKQTMFQQLTRTRQATEELFKQKSKHILVDLRQLDDADAARTADALTAVVGVRRYQAPSYTDKKPKASALKLTLLCSSENETKVKAAAKRSALETVGTNTVRHLAERAPNDLTCKNYVKWAKDFAQEHNFSTEVFSVARLKKLGAGAFLAVAQGSNHDDAAIIALHYQPKQKATKRIAFVGKGIVYDTGGVNLKPASFMLGMHGDMTGSAVAAAMVQQAALHKWPEAVSAYLAIADNAVGSAAYRPNEVIKSLSGKTIEIVNTDAEGRMALADTLTLVSRTQPDLIVDYATLTGSAIRAIGTSYCTGYSNREELLQMLFAAGKTSGERVWGFPLDPDFAEALESPYADTKQCVASGGVDHINASIFLQSFIEKDIPWVHIDLAAAENEGGLAHVETKTTGFGVRFSGQLIQQWRAQ